MCWSRSPKAQCFLSLTTNNYQLEAKQLNISGVQWFLGEAGTPVDPSLPRKAFKCNSLQKHLLNWCSLVSHPNSFLFYTKNQSGGFFKGPYNPTIHLQWAMDIQPIRQTKHMTYDTSINRGHLKHCAVGKVNQYMIQDVISNSASECVWLARLELRHPFRTTCPKQEPQCANFYICSTTETSHLCKRRLKSK